MKSESPSSPYPFSKGLSSAQKRLIVTARHKVIPRAELQVASAHVGELCEGLGANLPRIDQPGQNEAYPHDESEWIKLEQHLDWLGIAWLRYWLFGEELIPRPGVFNPDHEYLRRLIRLHKWAERRDAHLILDFGVTPTWLRFKTNNARSFRLSAPEDIGAYVDSYAIPLVKHVMRDLGMRQIKYLSLFNEPFCPDHSGFSFYVPRGIDVFAHYVRLFERMRQRLDEAGFAELGMIGPNSHDLFVQPLDEMEKRGLDLYPHIAAVDEHCYRARLDYLPPTRHIPTLTIADTISTYLGPAIEKAKKRGKPYFLTEYGAFYYGGITGDPTGPARHDAAINEVEFVIRSLAAGVAGAMKWSFLNAGQCDGLWQYIETADRSYAPVPNVYYAHAVLTRFTPRGAAIYPVAFLGKNTRYLHGVLLRRGDDATLLVVNDHPAEQADLHLGREAFAAGKPLAAWSTDATRKFVGVALSQKESAPSLLLQPMSVTTITTFALGDEEDGML